MNSLIKKGLSTVKNDGAGVFLLRLWNYSQVKVKRVFRKQDAHNLKKWEALKNKYKGERLFVMGNGPSLNSMPLYLLRDEYTMCFNRINLLYERIGWKPDFYVAIDDLVIRDNFEEINTEVLPNVKYAFFPDIHPSNLDVTKYIQNKENVSFFIADKPEFSDRLPYCGHNKTVVNAGLQVAAHLGFTEIYLIGVDMTFGEQKVKKINSRDWEAGEDDPNHFDPRYFKKGKKYHNPTVHEMLEQFAIGKTFFDKLGVKIFNAGLGGKLEVFPRIAFNTLLDTSLERQKELIAGIALLKQLCLTVDDLEKSANMYAPDQGSPTMFKAHVKESLKLIPKLIMEYVPLGPYQDHYYFIKRPLEV